MGKRSSGFERQGRDLYPTPYQGVRPLVPFLDDVRTFAEPCAGDGRLVGHLQRHGLDCRYSGDIAEGKNALTFIFERSARFDAIITNPPWDREILHPMIVRFQSIAPTWLLLEADWAHTIQAAPFMQTCSHMVSVGRLKWIEDSAYSGKDNCAWYRFDVRHAGGCTFFPRGMAA